MAMLDMTVVAENVYKFLLKYVLLVFIIITLNLTNLQHGGMPELYSSYLDQKCEESEL